MKIIGNMAKKIFNEIAYFKSHSLNVKTLLITNMLYAMILPVIEIFVGAYIMRNTNAPAYVAIYQLCMYVGVLLSSLLNGFLLARFKSRHLYAFGIILSTVVMAVMMFIRSIGVTVIGVSGLVLGFSTGFFWTNRYLLTLNATNDSNRNYFFGLESFFFTVWSILIPLVVGGFLVYIRGKCAFGRPLTVNNGYQVVTIVAIVIGIIACIVLSKGKFENPVKNKFLFAKFHLLWRKMLTLAGLKGMVQGFLVTTPAILVMRLVGEEGELGLIQGVAGMLTAILVYVLGRVSKPEHRMPIFGFGLLIFFIGTLFNAILFSATGVIIFIFCKVMFQPIHDLAYFPTMMKTIDKVKEIEKRSEYAYIMSHEVGLFIGRAFGMLLFIALSFLVSEIFALKYALVIVGTIQLLSLPLAKHIVKEIDTKYADA